jgi:hypothetical protein
MLNPNLNPNPSPSSTALATPNPNPDPDSASSAKRQRIGPEDVEWTELEAPKQPSYSVLNIDSHTIYFAKQKDKTGGLGLGLGSDPSQALLEPTMITAYSEAFSQELSHFHPDPNRVTLSFSFSCVFFFSSSSPKP